MKSFKQIVSWLLMLSLLVTLAVPTVFAADDSEDQGAALVYELFSGVKSEPDDAAIAEGFALGTNVTFVAEGTTAAEGSAPRVISQTTHFHIRSTVAGQWVAIRLRGQRSNNCC